MRVLVGGERITITHTNPDTQLSRDSTVMLPLRIHRDQTQGISSVAKYFGDKMESFGR